MMNLFKKLFTFGVVATLCAVGPIFAGAPDGASEASAASGVSAASVAHSRPVKLGKVCFGTQLRRCAYLTVQKQPKWDYRIPRPWAAFNDPAGGNNYTTTIKKIVIRDRDGANTLTKVGRKSRTSLRVRGRGFGFSGCNQYRAEATFSWTGSSHGSKTIRSKWVRYCH